MSSVWLSPSFAAQSGRSDFDAREQPVAAVEFDGVALAVGEAERFDPRKTLQRPGEAGGGILSAGEQHQCGFGSGVIHGLALSTPPIHRPIGGNHSLIQRVSLGSARVLRHKGMQLPSIGAP